MMNCQNERNLQGKWTEDDATSRQLISERDASH